MYREVVGRETRSSDSAYLVWKLAALDQGWRGLGFKSRTAIAELLGAGCGA
jgi:hypothetical protein